MSLQVRRLPLEIKPRNVLLVIAGSGMGWLCLLSRLGDLALSAVAPALTLARALDTP